MKEHPLKDIDVYTEAMSKSIKDKLFFLEHLDPRKEYLFVDFGCADGTLLKELQKLGHKKLIGFDASEKMLLKARFSSHDILYTNDWYSVCMALKTAKESKILILSSVIHEVYSYAQSDLDIMLFFARILHSGFDFICLRDMCYENILEYLPTNPEDEIKVLRNSSFKQISDFENNFGSIKIQKNLVHYLLKYRYTVNWEREVNENYFPLSFNSLEQLFLPYKPVYFKPFTLDFIKQKVKEDFNIDLTAFTHIKAIFKNEN